jgi:hypothetical protein
MKPFDSLNTAMEIEDTFQDAGVFFNGIRGHGNKAHMDSYMTCIDYPVLIATWEKIRDSHSKTEWLELVKYWEGYAYLSPNCSQLASFVRKRTEKMP